MTLSLRVLAILLVLGTLTSVRAESRTAEIDGTTLHYDLAGSGEPLVLIHGYAQSAHMWAPAIPRLAKRFTVIAPDLPGFGESAIAPNGLDVTTAAQRIHALVQTIAPGTKVRLVGHDIGLMVAYAYAAMYPGDVDRLVLMDAFLPGIGNWLPIYHDPHAWHFFFTGPTPEALVKGRERTYFDHFWNDFAADARRSVVERDRRFYTAQFSRPGRMRAGWAYFAAFPQTAQDFAQFGKTKLPMPVLVIAGDKAAGGKLADQVKLVATNVSSIVLNNTGHWLIDERPAETIAALEQFLAAPLPST